MSPVRVRLGPLRGSVAQSVEQGTENPRVAGPIPAGTTIRISEVVTLLIRGRCSKLGQTACPDDVRSAFRAQLCVSLTNSKTVLYGRVAQTMVEQGGILPIAAGSSPATTRPKVPFGTSRHFISLSSLVGRTIGNNRGGSSP